MPVPNVAPIFEQRITQGQLRLLKLAAEVAARLDVHLFLVGGTVRDMLAENRPADLDLSVVGGTTEFPSELAQELGGQVVARSQFGTSKLAIQGEVLDLVTARKEAYSHPGALPDVVPGSIQDDLARRDFTINSMAISLSPEDWGQLLDPFHGRQDLQHGLIRVLHSGSFTDDATRILRAVRYAVRLRFQIEDTTSQLIERDRSYLDTIKGDRIRHELQRIFAEERAAPVLDLARQLRVLSAIYPTLGVDDSVSEALSRVDVHRELDDGLQFLSVLAYFLSVGDRSGLIARLNMDSRWAKVVADTGSVRDAAESLGSPDVLHSQLHHLLRQFDPVAISGSAIAVDQPLVASRLQLYLSELRHVKPSLNGDDLIDLGVPMGPMVGRLLDELLAARLDDQLSTRQHEEEFVARQLEQGLR